MGVSNISQDMLKNPHVDKKTNNSVHKCPLVEDTKRKNVQKRSQVATPRKWGQKIDSKLANAPLRR